MTTIQATRRVYHSADEMFDLVADVERYPAFVPLCRAHIVKSREKRAETEILMTDMTIAYRVFRESYTSRVTLDRGNGRILVESVDGPLRRLQTRWTFQSRPNGSCDVGFHLSYEFASRALAFLMGGIFDAAFSRFTAACRRCLRESSSGIAAPALDCPTRSETRARASRSPDRPPRRQPAPNLTSCANSAAVDLHQ